MILNMIGGKSGSGGGADLNFAIIGGTVMPETAAENTIWVNTDVAITDWCFSATAPESPTEGMVWITIGTTSAVSFNALKKNCIQVNPLTVSQYVESTWVTKEARSYQGGEWHDWIIYLFTNGNQNESITGGWSNSIDDETADGWSRDGNVVPAPENGGSIAIGTSMALNISIGPNINYQGAAAVGTRNKIDLDGRTKIKATCNLVFKGTAGYPKARLAINTSLITPQGSPIAYVDIPEGSNTVELDVSNISDPHHIIIGGISGDNGYTLTITQVTIE